MNEASSLPFHIPFIGIAFKFVIPNNSSISFFVLVDESIDATDLPILAAFGNPCIGVGALIGGAISPLE